MDIRDQTPRARTEGFLVEEVDDETLVYDLESHDAHCLNPTAALVWRRADGRTTVRDMVPLLDEVGLPQDESVIWMALSRLEDAGLVDALALPDARRAYSRKEMLRAIGSAVLLPVVASVVAPMAAQAASCLSDIECASRNPLTIGCTGLPVCGTPGGKCCYERVQGKKHSCAAQNC